MGTFTRAMWIAGGAVVLLAIGAVTRFGRNDAGADARPAATTTRPGRPALPGATTIQPPGRRVLAIDVPPDAQLTINGDSVGEGDWESDSLPPGSYTLVASVRAVSGCASARVQEVMTLPDTGETKVRLTPRKCGSITIDAPRADGASYTIQSLAGDAPRTGRLPLNSPLTLPEGRYRLVVIKTFCAEYRTEFSVSGEKQNPPVRFSPLC